MPKIATFLVSLLLLSLGAPCLEAQVADAGPLVTRSASLVPEAGGVSTKIGAIDSAPRAVLTTTEFERFKQSLEAIKDAKCRRDLNATLAAIVAREPWGVAMYDASAKGAYGIEKGLLHHFGHYDECLGQKWSIDDAASPPVRAQYCLVDVRMDGLTVHNIASRHKRPQNHTVAHWGVCVPASCSAADVATHMRHLLQRPVAVDTKMCQLQTHALHVNDAMFLYAAVICFFVFLAVLSTSYHVYLMQRQKRDDGLTKDLNRHGILNTALLSFSVIENLGKLFQASKDQLGLNSVNGIKALAMMFILAGHATSFIYGGPSYNTQFFDENIKEPYFAFLTNSLLFVDTFLLLSGFLFCRVLLIELERRRGKLSPLLLYVGRYIRLTPAYMAVICFYITWFPHVGDGPLWPQRIGLEQERCQDSWWLNILYINNYVNTDKLCMFQSWYLSVDSQLFFLAPIAIYCLYQSRKYGLRLLVVLVALTASIPFVVTAVRRLDPTLLVYSDEVTDLAKNAFYIGSYIKTHIRASAYFVGLLTGFLVHLMQEKQMKLPRFFVWLAWLLSIFIGGTSMFYVCKFYVRPYSNLESTLYAGFHRLGWNLSGAWLVLAVTTGHAGWLQTALSHRIFAPISRLTYCAYLSNGIVELYSAASIRSVGYKDYVPMINEILGHIFDTFVLAMVLCLLFESPIHALERILMRKCSYKRSHTSDAAKGKVENPTPSTSEEVS